MKALLVMVGEGGTITDTKVIDIPLDVWEDGECDAWLEDNGHLKGLVGFDGYELLSEENVIDKIRQLVKGLEKMR